jgi:predicted site-specific integrase-resolvase
MEEKEFVQGTGIIEQELETLLDAKDVARLLGISAKTVHKRVREGKLGCVQVTPKDRRFTKKTSSGIH